MSNDIESDSAFSIHPSSLLLQALDHRLDRMTGPLLVELVEHAADAGMLGKRVIEFVLVQSQQLRGARGGDGGRARFSGQHAHFAEKIPLAELGQVEGI